MQKELHIWMGESFLAEYDLDNFYLTLEDAESALYYDANLIHTVQTACCNTRWLIKGYRIFIHMLNDEIVEIVLGTENKNTDRNIKASHDIEKLLLANEFGFATRDYH